MKVFSYVVEHDNGQAPNPYFGFCTLCRCKFRKNATDKRNIVELADAREKDWIIGTGGNSKRSAGHGKLIYAMRVDEKLTRQKYYDAPRFKEKRPANNGTYDETRGDNLCPTNDFEKNEQFALVSAHFYYFGKEAIDIPNQFKNFEKKGPSFRYVDPMDFSRFLKWLETETRYKLGIIGQPCYQEHVDKSKGRGPCKLSC